MKACLIVPHFDHLDQFSKILSDLCDLHLPLILVDDASPAEIYDSLDRLLKDAAVHSTLIRHTDNQGKGGAVMTGLQQAYDTGYSHAIQIDADGQHDTKGIDRLLAMAKQYPDRIICGRPVFDDSISNLRYYGRFLTLYLVWLETLSTAIQDALCGFRIYPLESLVALIEQGRPGRRMAFDPEILVRAIWSGIRLKYIPVNIVYPDDGKSHFHYLRDNAEISWMHARLVAGMLLRSPMLVWRALQRNLAGDQR